MIMKTPMPTLLAALVTLVLASPGQSTTDRTAAVTAEIERIVGLSGAEVSVIYQPLGPGARPGIALRPDVVLLQELKAPEEAFPHLEIGDLGYNAAVLGQKTYNGVAILSKFPLADVRRDLPGDDEDEHARVPPEAAAPSATKQPGLEGGAR